MSSFVVPGVFNNSTRLLDGLADPTRVRILCLLGGNGRTSVSAIAAQFTMTRPAISHHLKVMLDSGLLKNEKSGQEVYYWVACDNIVQSLRGLADAVEGCCKGTNCCPEPQRKTKQKSPIRSSK